ncbi:MAG: hypothetical protein KIY12_08350 [Thermoplasmata archaeon]|uniref:Uncharacterized protein n=1 Tax=Candidatus Sysuiplasma superficiale TaxID=2823368 RepID=A0A8J7YQN3_9ARCH|nr:hypothetical protein [Candidatus Sysuiplasma superficiale]
MRGCDINLQCIPQERRNHIETANNNNNNYKNKTQIQLFEGNHGLVGNCHGGYASFKTYHLIEEGIFQQGPTLYTGLCVSDVGLGGPDGRWAFFLFEIPGPNGTTSLVREITVYDLQEGRSVWIIQVSQNYSNTIEVIDIVSDSVHQMKGCDVGVEFDASPLQSCDFGVSLSANADTLLITCENGKAMTNVTTPSITVSVPGVCRISFNSTNGFPYQAE